MFERDYAEKLRKVVDPLWKRIYRHPFIMDLESGRLPFIAFKEYILQNDYYQKEYNRCLALAAARSPDYNIFTIFAKILSGGIEENNKLVEFAQRIGISMKELDSVKPCPGNVAYTSFLFRACSLGTTGEMAAALCPCAWTYMDLGQRIKEALKKNYHLTDQDLKIYEGYSSPEMRQMVQMLKDLISQEAQRKNQEINRRMKELFWTASEFEYDFWGLTYRS
ncbi:hypothetical protein KEJ47_09400 [Candidatus Bathyarchaeota archaeon]|nr:hypothetical protein [Candidatus Bathyarchaeota archaeon]